MGYIKVWHVHGTVRAMIIRVTRLFFEKISMTYYLKDLIIERHMVTLVIDNYDY